MTDEELIERFFARSEDAVEELRSQYGAYCRAIAGRLLSDGRDVEECLSDCWMAVWNAVPPTRPEHFKGWLGAIVRNRALAIGRQNRRRPETVDEAALELATCLPAGEDAAPFANGMVHPVREGADKVPQAHVPQGLLTGLPGELWLGKAKVLVKTAVKQAAVLGDNGQPLAQGVRLPLLGLHAEQAQAPALWQVEAANQLH